MPRQTRERLLKAACEVFAAKGFRDGTVAEICHAAGANISAVSYHFGGKENLYRAAWRYAHEAAIAAYPPAGGVPASAPPQDRLRGRVRALVARAMDEDGRAFQIMSREATNPTGLLGDVFREAIRPLRDAMVAVVSELLGEAADPGPTRLCAMSIIAPCLQLRRLRRSHAGLINGPGIDNAGPDQLAEHIAAFSLAGIEGIRCPRTRCAAASGISETRP